MELYNAGEARNWLICGEIWDVPFNGPEVLYQKGSRAAVSA
jgi:hypothetical protein